MWTRLLRHCGQHSSHCRNYYWQESFTGPDDPRLKENFHLQIHFYSRQTPYESIVIAKYRHGVNLYLDYANETTLSTWLTLLSKKRVVVSIGELSFCRLMYLQWLCCVLWIYSCWRQFLKSRITSWLWKILHGSMCSGLAMDNVLSIFHRDCNKNAYVFVLFFA